ALATGRRSESTAADNRDAPPPPCLPQRQNFRPETDPSTGPSLRHPAGNALGENISARLESQTRIGQRHRLQNPVSTTHDSTIRSRIPAPTRRPSLQGSGSTASLAPGDTPARNWGRSPHTRTHLSLWKIRTWPLSHNINCDASG